MLSQEQCQESILNSTFKGSPEQFGFGRNFAQWVMTILEDSI